MLSIWENIHYYYQQLTSYTSMQATVHSHPRSTSRKINNLVLVTSWIKEVQREGLVHEVKFYS